jgi:hypothetical protein
MQKCNPLHSIDEGTARMAIEVKAAAASDFERGS